MKNVLKDGNIKKTEYSKIKINKKREFSFKK